MLGFKETCDTQISARSVATCNIHVSIVCCPTCRETARRSVLSPRRVASKTPILYTVLQQSKRMIFWMPRSDRHSISHSYYKFHSGSRGLVFIFIIYKNKNIAQLKYCRYVLVNKKQSLCSWARDRSMHFEISISAFCIIKVLRWFSENWHAINLNWWCIIVIEK